MTTIKDLKNIFLIKKTEGGVNEASARVETADVAIAADPEVVPKRVPNSNPDQLELAGAVHQQQRHLPAEGVVRARDVPTRGSNSGRVETGLEKRKRSFEVIPE